MFKFLISLILTFLALSTHSLDIDKACDELKEQEETLLTDLSTSFIEANMAGQCIGYSAIYNNRSINLNTACKEFIEHQENLLGEFSTSLIEANQAGICMGAIYAACGTVSYSNAAKRIINKVSNSASESYLRRAVGCHG